MTSLLPYNKKKHEIPVINAIRNGEPPVDFRSIEVPDFVQATLEGCWHQNPPARFEITRCYTMLQARATSLFKAFTVMPPDQVPSQYRIEASGWNAIRNPLSQTTYDLDFFSINNLEAWCAV